MTARRIEASRTRPIWRATLAVSLTLVVIGCGKKEAQDSATSAIVRDAATSQQPAAIVDPDHPMLRIETNQGDITLRLDAVNARGTVRNFLNYANSGFYDNTIVHYVDADKLIVAGGYDRDRSPKPARSPIRNEAHNGLKNVRGTIAMARDPSLIDSATSQFFINLADAPQRDYRGETAEEYGYCVFGQVIEGLDIAQRISHQPTTNLGGDLMQTPEPPVVISSIRVLPR